MRTPLLHRLNRSFRNALNADGPDVAPTLRASAHSTAVERRAFLKTIGASAAGVAVAPSIAWGQSHTRVAVVGAGLAGLACADRLAAKGVSATVYEASTRPGGRCFSLRDVFPGQVVERGGEFIDNLHKTMLGYAKRFKLSLEDCEKQPGEIFFHFAGQRWPEHAVVAEYRDFVAAIRDDLRVLSSAPTADVHTDTDVAFDRMSLAEYLSTRGAGPLLTKAIEAAYLAEYGLEIDQQSCLNFLFFIHADKRSRFMPFGVFSDERYHVIEGNDRIAHGLAAQLPSPVRYGHMLQRVKKTAAGRLSLTFGVDSNAVSDTFDYVVLAIPFTVLRQVELHASLQVPAWKRNAIDALGYGTNAKMMVGFDAPYWRALGATGTTYSDLPHHQTTWETSWTRATPARAVLTDYSSGARGAALDPHNVAFEAQRFLGDLDVVLPGAEAFAARDAGELRVHLEHWPSNPLSRGSYTCYRPGQFTTIAGLERKRIGYLLFAF
jgi:monoamine oxidase